MKAILSVPILCLVLIGCPITTLQSAGDDAVAKRFAAKGEQATIYIYRLSGFAGAFRVEPVFIDGRMLGQNGSGTFLVTGIGAGHHTVSTTAMSLTVDAKPGTTYFVRQKMSVWGPTSSVETVVNVEGKQGVLACQRAVALY